MKDLSEPAVDDPIERFLEIFDRAKEDEPFDHTAVALATADSDAHPSCRIVLLKHCDARGFVFFTNYEGRKGRELEDNPRAALCFYYPQANEQVRVEGRVEKVTPAESDEYYYRRPRTSQIGAWASQQSRPLASRDALLEKVAELEKKFGDAPIPRPPQWGGFRLIPHTIEFWYDGSFRLHDRFVYKRQADGSWRVTRLYP